MPTKQTLSEVQDRLKHLEHLLPYVGPNQLKSINLSTQELDKVRAYIVFSYAELEAFFEFLSDRLLDTIQHAVDTLVKASSHKSKISKKVALVGQSTFSLLANSQSATTALLLVNGKQGAIKAKGRQIDAALNTLRGRVMNCRKVLADNNSLNTSDIEKMFDRIGFVTEFKFVLLRANLDTLTSHRGAYSHSGEATPARVRYVNWSPDPRTCHSLVNDICNDLPRFVRDICTFCDP